MKIKLLIVTLLLAPILGSAAGLGKVRVKSALGERLSAEIDLIENNEEDATSLSARIASQEEYSSSGLQDAYVPPDLHLSITRKDDARIIHITTDRPVNEPFLELLIKAETPSAYQLRQYTLLLDPPTSIPQEELVKINAADNLPGTDTNNSGVGKQTLMSDRRSAGNELAPVHVTKKQQKSAVNRNNEDVSWQQNDDARYMKRARNAREDRLPMPQMQINDESTIAPQPGADRLKLRLSNALGDYFSHHENSGNEIPQRTHAVIAPYPTAKIPVPDAQPVATELDTTALKPQNNLQTAAPSAANTKSNFLKAPAKSSEPPPFESQKSFVDELVANIQWVVIGAGLPSLFFMGVFLSNRRRMTRLVQDFPDNTFGFNTPEDVTSDSKDQSTVEGEADFFLKEEKPGQSELPASRTDILLNDTDPVIEAEIYRSYGRDEVAETILKNALEKTPEKHEISLALLQIYHDRKDKGSFENVVLHMCDSGAHEDTETWGKIETLGQSLDPENTLYKTQEATPQAHAQQHAEVDFPIIDFPAAEERVELAGSSESFETLQHLEPMEEFMDARSSTSLDAAQDLPHLSAVGELQEPPPDDRTPIEFFISDKPSLLNTEPLTPAEALVHASSGEPKKLMLDELLPTSKSGNP